MSGRALTDIPRLCAACGEVETHLAACPTADTITDHAMRRDAVASLSADTPTRITDRLFGTCAQVTGGAMWMLTIRTTDGHSVRVNGRLNQELADVLTVAQQALDVARQAAA